MEVRVQQDYPEEINKKRDNSRKGKNHAGKIVLVTTVICVLLAACYVAGAVYFTSHFYPDTMINQVQSGRLTKEEVLDRMSHTLTDRVIKVYGRDSATFQSEELFEISGKDIDLHYLFSEEDVQKLLSTQNPMSWPFKVGKHFEYQVDGKVSVSSEKLDAFLENQPSFQTDRMVKPENAYLSEYLENSNSYEIVPEVKGSWFDVAAAKECLIEVMGRGDLTVDLEQQGCYEDPSLTAEDKNLTESKHQADQWLSAEITYDWNGKAILVNSAVIKDWIRKDGNRLSLDEEAIREFVKNCAEECDTYGKNFTYHTVLGYDLTLRRGSYGWKTDVEKEAAELKQLIEDGYAGAREPEYAVKARQKGTNDIGSSYVEADMTHQHLYLYQKGQLMLESDFVSGDMTNGNRTPEGIFGITYKTMNATLRGRDYVTPVVYWMPFYGNYGMHDATWRDTFGGDIYLTNGSHGCLNLPLEKAGEIYQYMTEGFPVICYYYPEGMLPKTPEVMEEEDD